jgi:hypothetical protein
VGTIFLRNWKLYSCAAGAADDVQVCIELMVEFFLPAGV